MQTDVLIVGGGLSGLHTAYQLTKQRINYLLVEARDRFGGRILSFNANGTTYRNDLAGFDMGPAWFWPGQSRMTALVSELNLGDQVFDQYSSGDSLYEDGNTVHRGVPGISMAGSYRMQGGMRHIVSALESRIDHDTLLRNAKLLSLKFEDGRLLADVAIDGKLTQIESDLAILALPPRLAINRIQFTPRLSEKRISQLSAIPTWMAGHAKIVAIYYQAFWRELGFSGDVISQVGPMREIHDASPQTGGPYALFGFVGVSPAQRQQESSVIEAAIQQLERLFGKAARKPVEVYFKDWACESETATDLDQKISNVHSFHDLGAIAEPQWHQKLIWSGSETAALAERNGGFLEGAVESSQTAVERIRDHLAASASSPPIS